jgi:post-segregation antitoxin (ccd killing protein)
MATRKITITLDEQLVDAMAAAAREAGIPLSRMIASAAEREMRRSIGLAAVAQWEAENGAFTPEELAAARAEMAAADDEYFRRAEGGAA